MYFILVRSYNQSVLDQARKFYADKAAYTQDKVLGDTTLLVYSDRELKKFNLVSIINNTGSIGNTEQSFLDNSHDEIAAKLMLDAKQATFITDYWGIFPFYYYQTKETFIISNNIFLVREMVDPKLSQEAIWEAMMFKRPLKSRTWYSAIQASLPNEVIKLDLADGKVTQSNGHYEVSLFEQEKSDYVEAMSDFFDRAFNYVGEQNLKPAISISAGSDSRTVLSGVMAHTKDFRAYSWGGDSYIETARIRNLVERFNIPWTLQDFDRFRELEHEMVMMTQLTSNGLAPGKHFYYHYSVMPSGTALFEGYGGSELFKTELSEGMLNEPYSFLVTHKTKPEYYLKDFFHDVKSKPRQTLLNFITSEYRDYLTDVNTAKGFEMHQRLVLEVIPSRIFNGVFNSALDREITLYEPFFSRRVLSAYYSNGLGLKSATSVTNSHPGKYKAVKPEAEIVKRLYPELLEPQLDRGFSLKETEYPDRLLWLLNKARNLRNRIRYCKNTFSGQVDMKSIQSIDLGKELHPALREILEPDYNRNNYCIEVVNNCLNGLDFVKTTDIQKLLS